ncbi:hypothetical protein GOP47_0020884 [Adiantum capillus-veneris]|uniref:Uncharacterized protein n=1 Tax=Adiantum capillus-veneris TaxID=13818 RepID=A0A9D4UBL6_ADICA|nr:hypothetical protein GOP47_0020884 [Adiantum capillus-veneris]
MKPIRLPVSNDLDVTDKKSVGESPKFLSNVFSGGRCRRLSLNSESLGCLSLLDAGDQAERPRAFPSPGLAGEILPSSGLKVHAQPTIHVHRPRAVLSSPENDELQGQQVEKPPSLKSLEAHSNDFPTASLSSDDFNDPMSPSVVPKAVVSPPDELLYIGEIESSISDEGSSCQSSNLENNNEVLLAHKPSNELVDMKLSRIRTAETLKEKAAMVGASPKSRHEHNGNEENLAHSTAANRLGKKHSGLPANTPRRSLKQQPSSPRLAKGNPGKALEFVKYIKMMVGMMLSKLWRNIFWALEFVKELCALSCMLLDHECNFLDL